MKTIHQEAVVKRMEKTIAAIEDSIAHWERLVNGTTSEFETTGHNDCALCKMFYSYSKGSCGDCPIRNRTGESLCEGSPYVSESNFPQGKNHPEFKREAKYMLDFLKEILVDENQNLEAEKKELTSEE